MSSTPIKSSYSILVMRDDCTVSTFRMRAFWLKVIIFAVIFLILSCAAAIYGTYYYHGRYQNAAEKRNALQAELTAAKVELQERRNLAILPMDGDRSGEQGYSVASMVKAYRPQTGPGESGAAGQTGSAAPSSAATGGQGSTAAGGAVSTSSPATGPAAQAGQPPPTGQTGQSAQSGQASHQADGAAGATTPGDTGSGAQTPAATRPDSGEAATTAQAVTPSATPSQSDLSAIMGQEGPVTVAGLDRPVTAPLTMERHPIKVSNLATAFEAGSKMRLIFDIANQPQKMPLSGDCRIYAITRQGAEIELPPVSRGSLTFRIERYRKMQTTMIVPGNLKPEDILSIKVVVTVRDNPEVYWNVFPI